MADGATFLSAFLRTPRAVGAVWPSGPALAAMMVRAAEIGPGDTVVELGAGTGPMTEALVAAHPAVPLLVLEPDPVLAAACRERVPGAQVEEALAQQLPELLAAHGLGAPTRVVSSLPFAAWPADLQDAVFDAIFAATAPEMRMVTFTYVHSQGLPAGRRARRVLEERFASVTTTPVVWANVPPALVYVCDRAPRPRAG